MTSETKLTIEILFVAAALVGVFILLLAGMRRGRGAAWLVAAAVGVLVLGALGARSLGTARHAFSQEALAADVPRIGGRGDGFVTSATCRSCHPGEYHSWHASYHRTMTQIATPETALGDFDDVTLHAGGRTTHLSRRGDELWADMVDPDWTLMLVDRGVDPDVRPEAPRADRRVIMSTGSHHYQAYWVPSAYGRMLVNFPFAWLKDEERWVPREAVFLRPPDEMRLHQQWNTNCIRCHSVAGEPGVDPATAILDSSVAELGISCEACHGPAEEHVRANRSPRRRYEHHRTDAADPTIVQPERLTAERSSQVCGQCHSIAMPLTTGLDRGARYRAGDDLAAVDYVIRGTDRNLDSDEQRTRWREAQEWLAGIDPHYMTDRYWPDGMVRVAGREYNGLLESPCYEGGAYSCLSCHSMHESDANDQLAAGMETDAACLQCHAQEPYATPAHTHHPIGSSGAGCYDCHMPHTTYGLLKAIRSHHLDSPRVGTTVATGRPNACNVCHLDRSLAWTDEHLHAWYGHEPVALDDDDRTIAASIVGALRGDAAQRALAAWSLGWEPARAASGDDWIAPYLAVLLDDPYAAVRYVADRSLRTLPGYEDLDYDFVGPAADRARAARTALERWRAPATTRPEVLLDGEGGLRRDVLDRLRAARNDRPVELIE